MQPRATLELALIGEKENLPHMHINMAARSDYNNITLTDEHKRLSRLLGVAAFCWNNAFLRGASAQVGIVWHQVIQSVMEYDADVCRVLCLTSFSPSCLVLRHTAAFWGIQLLTISANTNSSSEKSDNAGRRGREKDSGSGSKWASSCNRRYPAQIRTALVLYRICHIIVHWTRQELQDYNRYTHQQTNLLNCAFLNINVHDSVKALHFHFADLKPWYVFVKCIQSNSFSQSWGIRFVEDLQPNCQNCKLVVY